MVAITQIAVLAAALAGPSAAQFFGMTPKQILAITKSLPPGMVTPALADNFNRQVNGKYGKVADTSGISRRQVLTSRRADIKDSKTVKIRYGPYTVPSMMHKNGLEEGGALWNYADKEVEKPCEKCVVVGLEPGLEYANGTSANIDTGSWLHHFVLFNNGPGRVDATCETAAKSLPHIAVGTTPKNTERVYASGNERVALDTTWGSKGGKPMGYHLNAADKFKLLVDFMNESDEDRTLWLTMTFDVVDDHPSGWDDVRPLWFDLDQCGFSDVHPKQQSGKFSHDAVPWKSTVEGEMFFFSHLHDGGKAVEMTVNGKTNCISEASYAGTPAFIGTSPMMDPRSATEHISNMTICGRSQLSKGDSIGLRAYYDYDLHKGMVSDDPKAGMADIMGITFMYLRKPRE